MSYDGRYYIGLDLGQSRDYSALSVLHFTHENEGAERDTAPLVHLERFALGTRYTEIVRRCKELMEDPAIKRLPSRLVVDATGVGRPVIDLMDEAELFPESILITGGDTVSYSDGYHRVPKRELVNNLLLFLEQGMLKIPPDLPLVDAFKNELLGFEMKTTATGRDTYEAARESIHDDLVICVALPLWYAAKKDRPPRFFYESVFS